MSRHMAQEATTTNATPTGGENLGAGVALVTARVMGFKTTEGTQYRSAWHAQQRLEREAYAALDRLHNAGFRPFIRKNLPLSRLAVREDGTSRITVHTYRHGKLMEIDDSRKGEFFWNPAFRHLCGCGNPECLGRNGYKDGNFAGSLCKINHPATPSMPLVPAKEGRDFDRKVSVLELVGASIVKNRRLSERVGGGSRGLNIDCPEYRRNMTGCYVCGGDNCWGKTKTTFCRDPYQFAHWPYTAVDEDGVEFAGWTEVGVDPAHPDYASTVAALEVVGSVLRDRPAMVGGV